MLWLCYSCGAATRYVSTNGTDSGTAASWATAWRTLTYAEANAANGDTIQVGAGQFNESVYVSGITNLTWSTASNAQTRAFRVGTPSNTFSGFRLIDFQDELLAWWAFFRLEKGADFTVITNCWIGEMARAEATNFTFNADTDTITSTSVDFVSAGFRTNGCIWWGGCSLTNLFFANMAKPGRITAVASNALTIADGSITNAETNTSAWSFIHAGTNRGGICAVKWILTGSDAADFCTIVSNVFTNLVGFPVWDIYGVSNVVQGNTVAGHIGGSLVHLHGSWHQLVNNYIHDCTLPIYYSAYELNNTVSHNNDYYDYVGGFLHTDSHAQTGNSNILVSWNWFENIEQPLWQLSATAEFMPEYVNWSFVSNVWVGVMNMSSGSLSDQNISHNTFYRCAYNEQQTRVFNLGGSATNLILTNNLILDCGDHSAAAGAEGWAMTSLYGTIVTNGNKVVGAEILGDNMLLRDVSNPRGADGVPWTADDGLRPLPTSPLVGAGALSAATLTANQPIAHFTTLTNMGWIEATGSNYSPSWQALTPFQRGTLMRPYTNGSSLTRLPKFVNFQATNSISETWSTTNWVGITDYLWDFGDGGRSIWTRWPDVGHTWLVPGTYRMTLTVTNSAGNTASFWRDYQVLTNDGTFTRNVFYVSTNGNDGSGTGSYALPWRTITNGVGQSTNGDYVAVLPGNYLEWVDGSDSGAESGTSVNPITIVGYNASLWGVRQEHSWWTWEGFEIQSSNIASGIWAAFDMSSINSGITLRNNWWHDGTNGIAALILNASGNSGGTNFTLVNNLFERMDGGNYGIIKSGGQTNLTVDANIMLSTTGQGDFLQCNSCNVTVKRNYCYNLGDDNHPDFFQIVLAAFPVNAIVIERNWVECAPAFEWGTQIAQMASGTNYATSFSNCVFRNNVFVNVPSSLGTHLDGIKVYNNLFYRCASWFGNAVLSGGENGSCLDLGMTNNVFFECGTNRGIATSSGWYQNGLDTWGTNATVYANYNYVCGSNYAAKATGAPDSPYKWAITGQEANGINGGNPLFVAPDSKDFRLQTNSPLVGVGTVCGGFTDDYFGLTRPAAWSIGPFESGTAQSSPARIHRVQTLNVGSLVLP